MHHWTVFSLGWCAPFSLISCKQECIIEKGARPSPLGWGLGARLGVTDITTFHVVQFFLSGQACMGHIQNFVLLCSSSDSIVWLGLNCN